MNEKTSYTGPRSRKMTTAADIVFCIDATYSMQPCFDSVKAEVDTFVSGLQSKADVDFRLRLIAYRDLHDPGARNDPPWTITSFTNSVDEFRNALASVTASGGGDLPESTLDALYLALHSPWRPNKTHKTIVLLTDDDTHPKLAASTYNRPDNDVYRVIQDFQTLRHAMLYMVLPEYPLYTQIEQSMKAADRKILAQWVPKAKDDERYKGLRAVPWSALLKMLGETISLTSVAVAQSSGG